MHTLFSDWYREVDANPSADKLELMWDATKAFADKALPHDQRLEVVQLALFENVSTEDVEEQLTSHFKEHDASFPARNNQHALIVLSSISLIYYIEQEMGNWYLIALAVVCGSWQKQYELDVQNDLLSTAKQQISEVANANRRLALGPKSKLKLSEFNKALQSLKDLTFDPVASNQANLAQQNIATLKDSLVPVMDALNTTLKRVASLPTEPQRAQEVLAEENNVLWWVFSEYSRELDKPTAEIHKDAWTLHAASELAALTTVLPAPGNMKAVLYKSLHLRDKSKRNVALSACINTCERDWRQKLLDTSLATGVETFAPVLTAIGASLQLDENEDWTRIFTKATGLSATAQVSRLELAWQTYQELLLIQTYRDE